MIVFLVLIIIISWKINSFDSEVRAFICGVENLKIYLLLVSLKISKEFYVVMSLL